MEWSSTKHMNAGKRSKRSALEADAVRRPAAEQMDPPDRSRGGVDPPTEGSHHREKTSARDRHTERTETANQEQQNASSSSSCDTNNQETSSDVPTSMVPGRIVQTVYPVRYQGTVLYIPTGGFMRPQQLLQKMRSEEWRFKGGEMIYVACFSKIRPFFSTILIILCGN